MKVYSLLAVFGFLVASTCSGISPTETALPTDTAPVPVPSTDETPQESTPQSRREARKKARKEQNSESDD